MCNRATGRSNSRWQSSDRIYDLSCLAETKKIRPLGPQARKQRVGAFLKIIGLVRAFQRFDVKHESLAQLVHDIELLGSAIVDASSKRRCRCEKNELPVERDEVGAFSDPAQRVDEADANGFDVLVPSRCRRVRAHESCRRWCSLPLPGTRRKAVSARQGPA